MGTEILVEKQQRHEFGLRDGVGHQAPLAICRKCQHRTNVVALKVRKVRQDLFFSHHAGEIIQDVIHGDSQATDVAAVRSA